MRRHPTLVALNRFPLCLARKPFDVVTVTDPRKGLVARRVELVAGAELRISNQGEEWDWPAPVREVPASPELLKLNAAPGINSSAILGR